MSVSKKLLAWGGALGWLGLTTYYIANAKIKMSVQDLMLMMPQCCEMTDLLGKDYIAFSPITMIKFCFGFVLLHFVTWWVTAEDVVEAKSAEVSNIADYVEKKVISEVETEAALLESSKSLVDNIDLELEHCAALIGANNETPGQRVGGEVEWATGETSSEDEDATREVIGAHIKKPNELKIEDEQILRSLTYPDEDYDENMSRKSGIEPNLMSYLSDGECVKSEASWPFRELEVE